MCTWWCSAKSRLSSCVSSTLLPMLTDASSTWHRLWEETEDRKNTHPLKSQINCHITGAMLQRMRAILHTTFTQQALLEWLTLLIFIISQEAVRDGQRVTVLFVQKKCDKFITHLANDIVLIVFLVQGQDGRNKFRNLLLQFITGHQMAHRAHGLSDR